MELNLNKLGSISASGMAKLRTTYMYVLLGIVMATIGAGIGLMMYKSITGLVFLLFVALEFGTLFWFIYKKSVLSYNVFTFLTGLTLAPLLGHLIISGQTTVIFQALLGTGIVVGGLTTYTLTTKNDFMKYSTIMFWILLALVIVSFINILIGSSLLALVISWISIVVFSIYIIIDTQEVLYTDIEPLDAAMNLYLDILNIFVSLLRILSDRD